jgi:uncharacterized protein (TIGR02466 family)
MQVDLTPDDGIAAAMHQQLEVFDRDLFGDPQFSNRNNLTGDLLGIAGLDQLHRMEAFVWLNQQIAEQVSLYLIDLLGPDHMASRFTSKRHGRWCVPPIEERLSPTPIAMPS